MNGFLIHLCAHSYRLNCARRPPEDGEINEITLPSRHRIKNLGPGGLRTSMLLLDEAPHNIESLRVSKEKTFCYLKLESQSEIRPRDL